MKTFTFKTKKRSSIWDHPTHHIKLNGGRVGQIIHSTWAIRLMVEKKDIMEDGNKNCSWKWIQLRRKSGSLDEAKAFLKEESESLQKMYKLHVMKD